MSGLDLKALRLSHDGNAIETHDGRAVVTFAEWLSRATRTDLLFALVRSDKPAVLVAPRAAGDAVGECDGLLRPLSEAEESALDDVFRYHSPTPDQVARHTLLRVHARSFAAAILRCCPPGEDAAAALRKVREALMTANAAVALAGSDSVQTLSAWR